MDMKNTWPPADSLERLEGYERYRNLFKGKHGEVFERVDKWLDKEMDKTIIYIVVNFAGLISKICADLLFGEPLQFHSSQPSVQKAVDRIVRSNRLHVCNYEMALSSSWRGDAVLKVRFGKRNGWAKDPEVIIETVPADNFFPDISPDNVQEMRGATIGWIREDPKTEKRYLRKEIHRPGEILNELWLLGKGDELDKRVPLSVLPEYADLKEQEDTGYDGLLVEHIPNWRLDDMFWGFSDYYDLESVFDALNNRISKIDRILDKHSDPKLILPPGSMQYDPRTRRYYIEKESIEVMEVDPLSTGDTNLPRYLVWDAHLDAAFKEIDKLLEMLMMMSETSPAAFGMDKSGIAESGRALKFKLLRTLAKINRKQLYFDAGLKNILYAAQVLDVLYGEGDYEPEILRIEWSDGLPNDMMEMADIESTRKTAGLTSIRASIKRLDGLDGEELDKELEWISQDQEKEFGPSPVDNIKSPPGGSTERQTNPQTLKIGGRG